jgi:hypothetical protein
MEVTTFQTLWCHTQNTSTQLQNTFPTTRINIIPIVVWHENNNNECWIWKDVKGSGCGQQWSFWLVFGRCPVRISAKAPDILTEVFCGLNAGRRQYVPPKCRWTSTGLHGVTCQMYLTIHARSIHFFNLENRKTFRISVRVFCMVLTINSDCFPKQH